MARTCDACGRANDDDANFCQQCGSRLGGRRRGKPAPRWLAALVAVTVVALAVVMVVAFFPRDADDGAPDASLKSSPGATVAVSPSPALKQYLAGAVGPRADRLAAIMDDGSVKQISRFSGQRIWRIAYSPDGEWLACIAGTLKHSELWLFNASNGAARQATATTPEVVAVDSIAWLSPTELLAAGFAARGKTSDRNAELFVYDTAMGRSAPLADAGGVALRGVSVSASRDGRKVSFVTYTEPQADISGPAAAKERLEVLDRASGQVREIASHKILPGVSARAFGDPLISPEGQAVIFRRARGDVGAGYTVVGVDGSVLMPQKRTLMPAGRAWDPTGTKVVFTGRSMTAREGDMPVTFWQFDTASGGAPRAIARYESASIQELSWSPDGATIAWAAYDRKRARRTGDIFLMPATGGASTPLVEDALSPVWAPGTGPSLQTSPSP